MRISVIMPVHLGRYEYIHTASLVSISASNPEYKFMRAVQSFLNQTFKDAELIIISDGCLIAEKIYVENYKDIPSIHFKLIEKQIQFSGAVRQAGIELAQGDIICYLDHDDFFGVDHLKIINENFQSDWIYYNDYVISGIAENELIATERQVMPRSCSVGTSSIAHKRNINVQWGDNYRHDWNMINNYLIERPGLKIITPEYFVCHAPGGVDF